MAEVMGLRMCLMSVSTSASAGEEAENDARRAFYGDFLVPRFAATVAMARGGCRSVRFKEDHDAAAESPMVIGLKELIRLHLVESGK